MVDFQRIRLRRYYLCLNRVHLFLFMPSQAEPSTSLVPFMPSKGFQQLFSWTLLNRNFSQVSLTLRLKNLKWSCILYLGFPLCIFLNSCPLSFWVATFSSLDIWLDFHSPRKILGLIKSWKMLKAPTGPGNCVRNCCQFIKMHDE